MVLPHRILLLVLLMMASMVRAGAQSPPVGGDQQPDVLIIAFAMASGQTRMSFAYPRAIPHAQAERDLQALETASGWHPQNVSITDALPPVSGVKQKMTDVDFIVTGGIDAKAGTLAVQPFVRAFQSYPHLSLTYFVDPSFHFRGLRDYRDSRVQVALKPMGPQSSTYTYEILLNGASGSGQPLSIPDTQSQVAAATVPHTSPWTIALIALVAAGTGLLVYTSVARAGQPRNMKLNAKGKKHAGTP